MGKRDFLDQILAIIHLLPGQSVKVLLNRLTIVSIDHVIELDYV